MHVKKKIFSGMERMNRLIFLNSFLVQEVGDIRLG